MNSDKSINILNNTNTAIIYGAQATAYSIYNSVKEIFGIKIKSFLVTQTNGNPTFIENIPVVAFSEYHGDKDILIIIATPETFHGQIIELLNECGYNNYLCINSHLEYEIMSRYFKEKTSFKLLSELPTYDIEVNPPETKIMMVKCHKDLPVKDSFVQSDLIIPIQAGAALTDLKIADFRDDVGDNISVKNRDYSELSATYWTWKNISCKYKGIIHYRRNIIIDEHNMKQIELNNVDVILPLPFICYPNTSAQYGRYISENDVKIIFQVLEELNPNNYHKIRTILEDKYIYCYNMLIAKEAVFNHYCEWLFPILFRVEKLINPKPRYMGYIGEFLSGIYFICNFEQLTIVHGEKKWLI